MKKKDYEFLVKEHEKLYNENPGLYYLSRDEIINNRVRKYFENYPECTREKKLEMIFYWSKYLSQTLYYQAFLQEDIALLNDSIHEVAHFLQISCVFNPGCDHGYFGMSVTPELLAANMFERIELLLPEENGLAKYSDDSTQIANILMAILYKKNELKTDALVKADKVLNKKSTPLYVKSYIYCMKFILIKDVESFNNELESFCSLYMNRKDITVNAFNRRFCIEAHALYNLALWAYDGELADKIRMPEAKNFCQELAYYQQHNKNDVGIKYTYPDDLDIYNKIMRCEPPKMYLTKKGNEQVIDTDRYFEEIVSKINLMD